MKKWLKRLLAVVGVAGLAALPAVPAAADQPAGVPVAAAAAPEGSPNPLAALNSCLVEQKAGDVLIMLDISASITDSDPQGARAEAAIALVTRLAARVADPTSEIAGAKLTVTVAGFGNEVVQGGQPVEPAAATWSALDQAGLPAITKDIESYRNQVGGLETDYWSALKWTLDAENAHSKAATNPGCHLVFWFTDGAYKINPRTSDPGWHGQTTKVTPWTESGVSTVTTKEQAAQVQADGLNDICRAGGLADQLRRANLTIAAIGLGSNESDFDVLKRIATNSASDCGKLPGTGIFDRADVTTLLLLVEGLGASDTQLPIDSKPVCQRTPCSSAHEFKLDSSLRKVHIVGVPSIPGLQVQVTGPKGEVATIAPVSAGGTGTPGTATVSGVQLRYQWVSDRQLTVDMVRPDDATNWTGTWKVTFIDTAGNNPDAVAATRVSLSADLALTANPAPKELTAGEKATFGLALTSLSGGQAVLGTPPPTMTGTVRLLPAASGAQPVSIATGPVTELTRSGVSWDVPQQAPLGPAKVEISLAVTTVTGIKLEPVVRQYSVTVKPAKGTPTVGSTALDFGEITGTATGTASLQLTGPGCVWVTGGALIAHPSTVDSVAIGGQATGPDNCLKLTEGAGGELQVTATPGAQGNGQVDGEVVVHLAPEGHPDRAAQQTVPYTMQLRREAQTSVVIGVFVAALVLGVGLPILVLWLTRRIAARYPDDVELVAARIPVLVGPRGLTTHGGGAPELPQQWNAVPPPTDGRRTLLVEGVRWRARTGPLWSVQPGYSEADRPGTGGADPFYSAKTFTARLPLGVQGSWCLLFRSLEDLAGPAPQAAGELVLISHPRADAAVRRTMLGEAIGQGPGLVGDLREAARARTGTAAPAGPAGPSGGDPAAPATGAGGPAPARPGGPEPVPGWGTTPPRQGTAAPGSGWPGQSGAQPAPGWGGQQGTQQAGPGWGQGAEQPGNPPASGWGNQPAPQQPGWGSSSAPNPSGWGSTPPNPPGNPPSTPNPPSWGGGRG